MKEVRYNDRMWFGKYKGSRFCDIIKGDPAYIQKTIKEGTITLDDKGRKYFEEIITGGRRTTIYGLPPNQPFNLENNIPQADNPQISLRSDFGNPNLIKRSIKALVDHFLRDRYQDDILRTVIDNFSLRVLNLNIPNNIVYLRLVKNSENISDLCLHILSEDMTEIARFTLND